MAAINERARLLAGYFLLNAVLRRRRDRQKRRKHRFWVRTREQLGLYNTLVQELKHEDREKLSSGISNLFVIVIFWEFVVKGFIALKFLHERGDRAFNVTFDLRRHFENKRGVFWDTFLLHLSCGLHVMVPLTKCCRITPTLCCICCRKYNTDTTCCTR